MARGALMCCGVSYHWILKCLYLWINADLRAAVMKKFPQTGLYVVEYVSGTGKVLQKFAISPLD